MSDTMIDVGGARLRCRFDGPSAAPALMLSNSLGTDRDMWAPQVDALAAKFRVLRYDTRGHGASAVTPGPYTIEQLGGDAVALLDTFGLDRVHFCGLSLGGMTGMWLGVHAPTRIGKLVLANTAAQIAPAELWNARIDKVRAGGMAAISHAVLERWFTPAFVARRPADAAAMKAMLERSPGDGYVAACAAVRDVDLRDAVSAIAAPTLVIAGAYDAATPVADGRFLAERIAGARCVELPAAHLSNIEAAQAFTDALLSFLAA